MHALGKAPLALVALLGVLSAAPTAAQDSTSVDREVIAAFHPGVVGRPPGVVAGPPDAFSFPPGLRRALQAAGVEHVAQLIPGFEPEDRFVVADWGEVVELTDWSDTYVLRLARPDGRPALIDLLRGRRGEVAYAEANVRAEPDAVLHEDGVLHEGGPPYAGEAAGPLATAGPCLPSGTPSGLVPNDEHFPRQWALHNEATEIQGCGEPDADINAPEAWELETGESWVKIGIVDSGMNTAHPDFTGRVTTDSDPSNNHPHGTFVAGIAAAQGNNADSIGVAGVAWNVGIINVNRHLWGPTGAVKHAYDLGAHVTNHSYGLIEGHTVPIRLAFADGYRLGRLAVAAVGNFASNSPRYPAAFGQGIVAVGATTNEDVRASYSNWGDWIDVAAPGGHVNDPGDLLCNGDTDCVYSTLYESPYYDYRGAGTSYAAPHVTGLVALLISFADGDDGLPDYNLEYYPDDVEQLIRRSAEDITVDHPDGDCPATSGFDPCYGTGRINARAALDLLRGGATLVRGSITGGGTVVATSPPYTAHLHVPDGFGLKGGAYVVRRQTVERTIPIGPYQAAPQAWDRGGGPHGGGAVAVGWGEEDVGVDRYSYGLPYTEVVAVSATSITLHTYVYHVSTLEEEPLGFYPTAPQNVAFAYTLLACCTEGAGVREGPPEGVTLDGVRPNPLGERGEVAFSLPSSARVHLAVYDVLGREVARLVDGEREAGVHRVHLEAGALPAGVYVVRLVAGTATLARRMTRLR